MMLLNQADSSINSIFYHYFGFYYANYNIPSCRSFFYQFQSCTLCTGAFNYWSLIQVYHTLIWQAFLCYIDIDIEILQEIRNISFSMVFTKFNHVVQQVFAFQFLRLQLKRVQPVRNFFVFIFAASTFVKWPSVARSTSLFSETTRSK